MTNQLNTDSADTSLPKSNLPTMSMNELGGMGAETGFDSNEPAAPLRFSGFLSLLLGLFSWVSLTAVAAVVVPVFAIFFGLIALRPSVFGKPVGNFPAKLGILLGVGFGACGLTLPMFKTQILGAQAHQFALQYTEVINAGYDSVGLELKKEHRNRFSKDMPLEDHYANLRATMDDQRLSELDDDSGTALIQQIGPEANWKLDRPVRIYRQYGIDRADVVLRSESGSLMQFFMQYLIDSEDVGQWHIEIVQPYRELIIAESVL